MYILKQLIAELFIDRIMIYVTLGTQPCDFSRCLKMIEELVKARSIKEKIIAQIGYTDYKPMCMECYDFIPEDKYQELIANSRVIISHAGTGALFSSIKKGKKVIAVARLSKYGEMVNNHQQEITKKLSEEGYILDGTESLINAWDNLDDFSPRSFDLINNIPKSIGEQIDNWLGISL